MNYNYDNGNFPEIDSLYEKMSQELNVPVPQYSVNQNLEPMVLGTYDTETKDIAFKGVPAPNVAVHEFAHWASDYHRSLEGRSSREAEDFAYVFEHMYGKANNLYRLQDTCTTDGCKVVYRGDEPNPPPFPSFFGQAPSFNRILNSDAGTAAKFLLGLGAVVIPAALVGRNYMRKRKSMTEDDWIVFGLAEAAGIGLLVTS